MNTTNEEIKKVVDTLPTGLYCGRRISLTLDEKALTSSYNSYKDTINISFNQIVEALKPVSDTCSAEEREQLIRSNVYHELSHAIMTPYRVVTDYLNIAEDERIERKLNGYYYNVNFEKSKYLMNGFKSKSDIPNPTSAIQAFYSCVRFGKSPKRFLDKWEKIYKNHSDFTRNSVNDYTLTPKERNEQYEFEDSVRALYKEIEKAFRTNPDEFNNDGKDGEGEGKINTSMDIFAEGSENSKSSKSVSVSATEKSEEDKEDKTTEMLDASANDNKEMDEQTKMAIKSAMSKAVKGFNDLSLFNKFETIIANFNKRNNGGSALTGYSGMLNPRLVANKDYRIFERKSNVQGNNSYGSLHLNLFIDVSGSFQRNEDTVNGMIFALTELERKYDFFSFDVVRCSEGQEIASKDNRYIHCMGGNDLTNKIYEQYRVLQKPSTLNYNIALFDGDAYSDSHYNHTNTFKAFDHNNCLVITDPDNKRWVEELVSTKPIVTRDYVKELMNHIIKALQIGFR